MEKSLMRDFLLQQRMVLDAALIKDLSISICMTFIKNFYCYKKAIGLYIPIKNEVDPRYITHIIDTQFGVPSINGNSMLFKLWHPNVQMTDQTKFKIPEPLKSSPDIEPDIIIVPIVGFDIQCNRIGYGKGFYDKFLATRPNTLKVGFAFECQKCERINTEAHDVPLDYIISERSIYYAD